MLFIRMSFIVSVIAATIFSYEEFSMPDLCVPTQRPPQSLEVNIAHRFDRIPSGQFPDNFITAANISFGLRYVIWSTLEAGTEYLYCPGSLINAPKEYAFHAAYSYTIPSLLRTQLMLRDFGVQSGYQQPWNNNFLYQFNVQTQPIAGRILPAVNFIYDGLLSKFGIGTGIDVVLKEDIDLVGEFYPAMGKKDTTFDGHQFVNCYSIGFKINTPGHHFFFSVGNSTDIGVRRLIHGAKSNNINFGFNIQRLIKF